MKKKLIAALMLLFCCCVPIYAAQESLEGRWEGVMVREGAELPVSFDFTSDALFEIDRFRRTTGCEIKALTVREILDEEIARKSGR